MAFGHGPVGRSDASRGGLEGDYVERGGRSSTAPRRVSTTKRRDRGCDERDRRGGDRHGNGDDRRRRRGRMVRRDAYRARPSEITVRVTVRALDERHEQQGGEEERAGGANRAVSQALHRRNCVTAGLSAVN